MHREEKGAVLSRFVRYVDTYKQWISKKDNYAKIKQAEDVARMVTLMLPASRDEGNPNILSESAFAVVNTLGILNDQIFSEAEKSPISRGKGIVAEKTRWMLTVLGSLAVIAEMCGSRTGGDLGRWKMIATVEAMRSLLRLRILYKTKWSTLENGGISSFAVGPAHAEDGLSSTEWWKGPRGTLLPLPPNASARANISAPNLPTGFDHFAGETLNVMRPFVFACMRLLLGRRSWIPILSFVATAFASDRLTQRAVDACEKSCRQKGLRGDHARVPRNVEQERLRRKLSLFWLLLREPLFSAFTRRVFESVYFGFSYIPLIRSLVRYIIDVVYYFQRHYFYSSGS